MSKYTEAIKTFEEEHPLVLAGKITDSQSARAIATAYEALQIVERLACAACTHPQEVGYCEKYCRIREIYALAVEALEMADRLEEGELKYEYALINEWFMNKYDLNVEHTELETDALHFTGMIMQTMGHLLDALADIRGDADEGIRKDRNHI